MNGQQKTSIFPSLVLHSTSKAYNHKIMASYFGCDTNMDHPIWTIWLLIVNIKMCGAESINHKSINVIMFKVYCLVQEITQNNDKST